MTAMEQLQHEAATLAVLLHRERISLLAEGLEAARATMEQAELVRVETLAILRCEAET